MNTNKYFCLLASALQGGRICLLHRSWMLDKTSVTILETNKTIENILLPVHSVSTLFFRVITIINVPLCG